MNQAPDVQNGRVDVPGRSSRDLTLTTDISSHTNSKSVTPARQQQPSRAELGRERGTAA